MRVRVRTFALRDARFKLIGRDPIGPFDEYGDAVHAEDHAKPPRLQLLVVGSQAGFGAFEAGRAALTERDVPRRQRLIALASGLLERAGVASTGRGVGASRCAAAVGTTARQPFWKRCLYDHHGLQPDPLGPTRRVAPTL